MVAGPMPPSTSSSTSKPLRVDQRPGLGDLRLHGGDVGLPPEAGVDGHDQEEVEQIDDVADRLDPRRRVQRHPRPGPEGPDPAERAVEVGAGLDVDDDQLAAGLDVEMEEIVGVADHQMGLEADGGPAPAGGDDVGPEGQVGDEVTVHHIPLDAIDPGLLEGGDVVTEPGEVGRQDGGDDEGRTGRHGTDDTHTS